ncbi:hypothetical protein [Viridibacillus arvi]|uniref:hypothetical protein n=1 Tax=Viridibacillus arvi TaxID=263475 RepID=UPI003D05A754
MASEAFHLQKVSLASNDLIMISLPHLDKEQICMGILPRFSSKSSLSSIIITTI